MSYKYSLVYFFLFYSFSSIAQGEFNNWYFSSHAAVSFSTGSPVSMTNNAMFTSEGSASISDKNGNLLFYTEGIQVWDRTHTQMPNGFGLNGDVSSTQSAVIVPKPGSSTEYYIFTIDDYSGTNGLSYSVVDMSLNSGLGDVTTKNTVLYTSCSERLAAVKHSNGCAVWIISHTNQLDEFYAYKVTSAGVDPIPVVSAAGRAYGTTLIPYSYGFIKPNSQGNKLATTLSVEYPATTSIEIFDFNNSTGVVSNPLVLTTGHTQVYDCEFSPNGNVLYGGIYAEIFQFNLALGTQAAINASFTVVGTAFMDFFQASTGFGALQTGPDGKIYQVSYDFLHQINSPNTPGLGCNYIANAIPIGNNFGFLGLPSKIVTTWVPPTTQSVAISDTCTGNNTLFNLADTMGLLGATWDFGDPGSGNLNTAAAISANHIYSSAGTYTITLIRNHSCKVDTISKFLTILPGVDATISSSDPLGCLGEGDVSLNTNITGGTSPYVYSWSTGSTENSINNLSSGSYSVTIKASNGCENRITENVVSDGSSAFFVPNVFSPNGDGQNDIFEVRGSCIKDLELNIYNRWGEKVFSAEGGPASGWDGTYKGKSMDAAVFSYQLTVVLMSSEAIYKKGNITLVR